MRNLKLPMVFQALAVLGDDHGKRECNLDGLRLLQGSV